MHDRRQHYRTNCRISACIEKPGIINANQYCQTSNIGMKGAFLTNVPHHPVGSSCKLIFQDRYEPLKINAKVARVTEHGVGFMFTQPHLEECLRLKHLVKPHWDGQDYMEGIMLILRYSKPTNSLGDCLSLTSLLSTNSSLFKRLPHKSCKIVN